MLSPRRSAQLGLASAVAVLALSITILVQGSGTAEQRPGSASQQLHASAGDGITAQQLVLGAHTSSLSH